jgi:hypothetical protein
MQEKEENFFIIMFIIFHFDVAISEKKKIDRLGGAGFIGYDQDQAKYFYDHLFFIRIKRPLTSQSLNKFC